MKAERRYDIDWLRVIAIALLLIYHIAIIFQPWAMFIGFIRSDKPLEQIWIPMQMLNVWRIPFLFFVSGMGLFFAMKKRSWVALLKERSLRILLPFVFGFIAITPIHLFIFQNYYNLPLTYMPSQGHLWFLFNIFCYVVILLPIFYFLKKFGNNIKTWLSKLMGYAMGPLSIAVFFVIEVSIVKPQLFAMYAETWHGFFIGLLAFFFGFIVMFSGLNFWKTISNYWWLYLSIALLLYTLRITNYLQFSKMYITAIESVTWIFTMFSLGYRYLNKPSHLLTYLSKAAYPIYIIHMFVLYALAAIIAPLTIHPFLQFAIITILTFVICFILYEFFIKRIYFLRPLFGLKINTKANKATSKLKINKINV